MDDTDSTPHLKDEIEENTDLTTTKEEDVNNEEEAEPEAAKDERLEDNDELKENDDVLKELKEDNDLKDDNDESKEYNEGLKADNDEMKEDHDELEEETDGLKENDELKDDSGELEHVSLADKEETNEEVQQSEAGLQTNSPDKEKDHQPDDEETGKELNKDDEVEDNREMNNSPQEYREETKIEYISDSWKEINADNGNVEVDTKSHIENGNNINFNRNDSQVTYSEETIQDDAIKESLNLFKANTDPTATVKFVMMPSGQVVTLACTLRQTLEDLKLHFATELKMSSNLVMLLFNGKTMPDTTNLEDLGVGPNGTIQLEILSADPVNTPLKQYRPRQEYHMPDVITVRVTTEDCETKDVVVEIERSRNKKPFLGGFRNKNTGVEYHNASAQTMQKQRPLATSERFCRDTQTCEQKNNLQQTFNTTSTQMTGIGCYMSNMEDKLMSPKQYVTADEYREKFLNKVIILQKNFRSWLAKRYVQKLKEDKEKRLAWERREELRKKKEKEERIKKEYARRINPQSKSDFDLLLHCLEKWRLEEIERINSSLTGAERKAALCMLLDQETELLSAIERHKNEATLENRDKQIMAFLERAAAPKKWAGPDGKLTFMDTPYTIRAKELRDIYNSINMKYLTQDERLDVLLTLKHTVKEHDCKLTQEITELIDREADLLMRGVKESNLTGLRKRISTLFLQYIKTPAFNPEAARLLKIPQDPNTLRKNINYCRSCGSYLPSTEFFITSNTSSVGRCKKCEKIENDGRQREDHNYYRVMLKVLRKSEESLQDGSSICYLLQEKDLRYLVENIWSNQSVLSAWDDIYDLVLARWDKHQEWSPWNCILLTHDEAEAHKKLFSLEEGYGQVFIHKVTQKHNFARNYFSQLPGMAEVLRKKIDASEKEKSRGPSVAGHSVAKAQKV